MLVSACILVITFAMIFAEDIHKIHRTKIALAGAIVMILVGQVFGFYNQHQAVAAIDWNVIFLLGAMMTIVAIMIPTGGFDWLAYVIANWSKGRLYILLITLGTAVTLISLILDNVTTVVIFGALTIFICRALSVNPIPYLLAEALLSDTGGVATLVGDPPNIMIGSAAGIDFNTFIYHMGDIVLLCWLSVIVLLKFLFRKELAVKNEVATFRTDGIIKDPETLRWALISLGIIIFLFTQHARLHLEAGLVAMIGFSLVLILARKVDIEKSLKEVELPILLFFISLFVVVGGVEHSHLLSWLGQYIVPFAKSDPLMACLLLLWGSAIISAAIDNIPFTVAMIPIISSMEAQGVNPMPFWWCLALGVGLGGNGTHIGSTANVYIVSISERVAKELDNPEYRITPSLWFKKGTPAMLLTLIVATVVLYFFFDFYSTPLSMHLPPH
ncbi:MAG: ArsB/NhaD family transporter [Nitrospinae bacterium]|nr:ArsB/NhaD family transporter [Nitrospinota bacterium]